MKLGHTPSTNEWDAAGRHPVRDIFVKRFGSWHNALRAAGLEPGRGSYPRANPASCIKSLRVARSFLGWWPKSSEFQRVDLREELHRAGLPASHSTVKHHLGSWSDALRKAGKR